MQPAMLVIGAKGLNNDVYLNGIAMQRSICPGLAKKVKAHKGFTLIELMIAVAIIGILAAIALPSYTDYVTRGKLVDATNTLSAMRVQMEQYYQDNRTYVAGGGVGQYPCGSTVNLKASGFTVSCSGQTATAYLITAAGSGSTANFKYTVDQANLQSTVQVPDSKWGTVPQSCWIMQKGATC